MAARLTGPEGRKPGMLVPVLALALGLVTACGPARLEAPSAAANDSPAARLDSLVAQDRRVAEVAWRLATANASLCPVVRPRTGWVLHAANQYGAALRPLAIARFGLEGDLPGLLAAPRNSPAAQAGLAEGDLITTADGRAMNAGDAAGAESFDGLAANLAVLAQAEADGVVNLTVRRAGRERPVMVRPVPACAYGIQIEASPALNGRSDGRHVFITSSLADLARNDDELAFFVAHELAHAVLEHHTVPDLIGERGAENARITVRRGLSASSETDADHVGLFLAARAGYDPEAAIQALTAYGEAGSMNRFPQVSLSGARYPSPAARRRALEGTAQEISRRQREGLPLIP
jgi:Zn-dependent protease with chaperone function